LLGLPHDYIAGQFGAWRTGERRAAAPDCMGELTSRLTPADVTAVAYWLAAQRVPANSKPVPTIALPLPMECGSGLR
jgi:cytochrome c553